MKPPSAKPEPLGPVGRKGAFVPWSRRRLTVGGLPMPVDFAEPDGA